MVLIQARNLGISAFFCLPLNPTTPSISSLMMIITRVTLHWPQQFPVRSLVSCACPFWIHISNWHLSDLSDHSSPCLKFFNYFSTARWKYKHILLQLIGPFAFRPCLSHQLHHPFHPLNAKQQSCKITQLLKRWCYFIFVSFLLPLYAPLLQWQAALLVHKSYLLYTGALWGTDNSKPRSKNMWHLTTYKFCFE